jgi:hypothetical protein
MSQSNVEIMAERPTVLTETYFSLLIPAGAMKVSQIIPRSFPSKSFFI